MRSKILQKILDDTTQETVNKVMEMGDSVVRKNTTRYLVCPENAKKVDEGIIKNLFVKIGLRRQRRENSFELRMSEGWFSVGDIIATYGKQRVEILIIG